jgi:hypothetical protein
MIKTVKDFREIVKDEGKFFSVRFIKKDGEERKMVARLGVRSRLNGKGASYNAESVNNLVIFSTKDNGYRTINIDRLVSVKAYGIVHTV